MVLGQETNMVVDYGTKVKTLELRDRCKTNGIHEALIPVDRDRVPDHLSDLR